MKAYDVMLNGEKVGHVTLVKEGLYYLVDCSCRKMDGIFRLTAQTEMGTVPIGVCVPEGREMKIRRRIAAINMGKRIDGFSITGERRSEEQFVPLTGELSSDCLQRLSQARFCAVDGCPGLMFPQDSGRT